MHDTIESPNNMTVRQHKLASANSQFASLPMAGLCATQVHAVKEQEKIDNKRRNMKRQVNQ